MELPILMAEDFWLNSQLSVARFSGGLTSGGKTWLVIPPANDLVRQDFSKYYCKLGRDRFLEVLKEHQQASDKELLAIYKELTRSKKKVESETINFE